METLTNSASDPSRLVWEPLPRSKCPRLASTGAAASDFLKVILFFGGLALSVILCVIVFGRPAPLFKDPIWWVCAVVLSIGPFLLFEWQLTRRHNRKQLSIDQNQICFGGSCVPLAELKSISSGQFKVVMERFFPSLEKAAVMVNRPVGGAATLRAATDARQKLRDHSLTITKQDGKQVPWIGALAFFESSDLEAFFATLRQRKPELEIELPPIAE